MYACIHSVFLFTWGPFTNHAQHSLDLDSAGFHIEQKKLIKVWIVRVSDHSERWGLFVEEWGRADEFSWLASVLWIVSCAVLFYRWQRIIRQLVTNLLQLYPNVSFCYLGQPGVTQKRRPVTHKLGVCDAVMAVKLYVCVHAYMHACMRAFMIAVSRGLESSHMLLFVACLEHHSCLLS